MTPSDAKSPGPGSSAEIARLFSKLGLIGFGGPAAHIAMIRREVVLRRGWLNDEEFLDLLGATNLIPGPSSTEMAIHIGARRAGWRGLATAGICFIAPAMAIVLVLAWLYVRYGSEPRAEDLLYGIKPVVVAIVVHALFGLGKTALKSVPLIVIAATAVCLYLLDVSELGILVGSAVLMTLWANRTRIHPGAPPLAGVFPLYLIELSAPAIGAVALHSLFLIFLKLGFVVFGSGYVLLAFLRADLVEGLGWLTNEQLLDAVAVGQFTPGPLFTTATFIGYIIAGLPGALVATLGIFLPSFLLVAALNPLIPRLRRSPWLAGLLDGVNAAALGLMAGVTLVLGQDALVDPLTMILAIGALAALIRWDVNSALLVALGGAVGLIAGA